MIKEALQIIKILFIDGISYVTTPATVISAREIREFVIFLFF